MHDELATIEREADCLFDTAQVDAALDRMAADISRRLHDKRPLLLCVMNGGLVLSAELMRRLAFPMEQDYLHATRYRGETRGGELNWVASPSTAMAGRHLLIVDDILDEGITLTAIVDSCRAQGAASVTTAVLVTKLHDRKPGIREADICGLDVPDRYVFGFGMDYKGYFRNARGIYAVKGM